MEKRIVFVGESQVTSDDVTNLEFSSDSSLLDGDIIIFSVNTSSYGSDYSGDSTFQGLRCLGNDSSFQLRRDCQHWSSELDAVLRDGKTVIVYLTGSPELQVATGEVRHSGTGRNARATRIVETFDPYCAIPFNFGSVVRRSGERIKVTGDLGILATYWHDFGDHSAYEAYIDNFKGSAMLHTQTGGKVVGGILHLSKGTLIFLPPPDLSAAVESRIKELKARQKKKPDTNRTAKAQESARDRKKSERSVIAQYIAAIVALDKAARSASETTPPPAWADDGRFSLNREAQLRSRISEVESGLRSLVEERKRVNGELRETQRLRSLLFEKGKPLEQAILIALRLLGFRAENYQEADSEFDAVIVDPTGIRLIGEAEGKDDKAISVDKLDQLDRNLKEDFARQAEEKAQFALGVLFGNAYRLTAPEERQEFFTAKCLLAAKRSHINLVRTTDLFAVARYLDDSPNEEFAAKCRRAIIEADGEEVEFPTLPAK
ncbi:MAG: hypothetical protein ABR866_02715 [Candidatus Korobacteraceae bacterium]|jgi:hypothetical protein